MAFSDQIKSIRKKLNVSQDQLAKELNVSFSTINRWENGHTIPNKLTKSVLYEFCKRNGIGIDLL
jgi:putative transcriptional regulator